MILLSVLFIRLWLQKPQQLPKSVGAFQNLPMVMPSDDLVSSAKRKARRISPSKGRLKSQFFQFYLKPGLLIFIFLSGITNIAKREKNKAAKHIDALMKVCYLDFLLHILYKRKYVSNSLINLNFVINTGNSSTFENVSWKIPQEVYIAPLRTFSHRIDVWRWALWRGKI